MPEDLIGQAWAALASDESGSPPVRPAPVEVTGSAGHLASCWAVQDVAVACVGAALLAAAALAHERGAGVSALSLDGGHVADAVRSERFFSQAGRSTPMGFAPLSRFFPASDGWVRTHANYPWHRRALVRALRTTDDAEDVAAAVARLPAHEVEERVFAAGGIAAAVRSLVVWRSQTQGRALAAEPLIGHRRVADAEPRRRGPAELPLSGVRVLDLTRVIAGPVCTRYLAALGAEVLRLDPPRHADMAAGVVADTLLGKRSSLLDLEAPAGVATLHDLLDGADVVVCGYRPGALDRFGLDEGSLAERHPGLVAVYLDAWGHTGGWSHRRGFDSVVQAPTGIALGESPTPNGPGALPCQLLDHGTGYLAAAAAMDGLRRQGTGGGTLVRRLSLARTALWLTSRGARDGEGAGADDSEPGRRRWLVDLDSARGPVTAVAPPGTLGDRPLRWPRALTGYGDDPAAWPSA
jgi:hypothetical protein